MPATPSPSTTIVTPRTEVSPPLLSPALADTPPAAPQTATQPPPLPPPAPDAADAADAPRPPATLISHLAQGPLPLPPISFPRRPPHSEPHTPPHPTPRSSGVLHACCPVAQPAHHHRDPPAAVHRILGSPPPASPSHLPPTPQPTPLSLPPPPPPSLTTLLSDCTFPDYADLFDGARADILKRCAARSASSRLSSTSMHVARGQGQVRRICH